ENRRLERRPSRWRRARKGRAKVAEAAPPVDDEPRYIEDHLDQSEAPIPRGTGSIRATSAVLRCWC
ncbi:hypothetical protein ACP3W2_27460, partial [Salmonella enterica]|uniref:hypothetical protein n=1 Tax=Salmonella enterica TaxID=28901 RepID=UPI003CEF896B